MMEDKSSVVLLIYVILFVVVFLIGGFWAAFWTAGVALIITAIVMSFNN
jgi:hypothetical protein